MRHFFTDHARDRARERYGRDFQPVELNAIFNACIEGRALLGRKEEDGTTFYHLRLADGSVVCPCISRQRTFILTFMPADFFIARRRRESAQAAGLLKQVFAGPKRSIPRPYRRERISLATLRTQEDFG